MASTALQQRRVIVTGALGMGFDPGKRRNGAVAVVFGASGGIGNALVQKLLRDGTFPHVVGFSRGSTPSVDLLDEDSLERAAAFAGGQGDIRLVIDATGFLHDEQDRPEKSLRELNAGKLARAFALNAIGPALIMKHMLPLLPRDGKAVFAKLSARVGSIGDNKLGGWYGYRASKAAVNQLVRTAAIELRRRAPEAICVVLHPGTVATPLSMPFAKVGLDAQTPAQSAELLLNVIERLGPDQSGGFFDHNGQSIVW
jgi:NAD(P)-dependent dehydrogenase (short-subunit alcohol dehydrogenase family)